MVELIVDDGSAASDPVSVIISTNNSAPVADAGRNREITQGTTVELNGTASSDVDGNAITYAWTLTEVPAGSAAVLSGATSPRPSFFADLAGDYVFELIVNDGTAASDPASVTLSTGNIPPVADAGTPKTKPVLEAIILDSIDSYDGNGDQISHMWSVLSSPAPDTLAIGDTNKIRSGISYSAGGDYVIQLIVDDGSGPSVPKTVLITTGNTVPIADAGPDQSITFIVGEGDEEVMLDEVVVALDGAGSTDDNGDGIIYRWALIHKPAGSTSAIIDVSAVRPGFTADMEGTYIAQLIVDDGTTSSRPSTVVISTVNVAPVADAGPDQFKGGNQAKISPNGVQLNGSGSDDADGDTLSRYWALIFKPNKSDSTISNPASGSPTFILDKNGSFIAQLIVSDGTSISAPDTVFISAPGNKPVTDDSDVRPVADADADQQQVNVNAEVQLRGWSSLDAQSEPLTYRWFLIHRPAGSTTTLSDPTNVNPTITPDVAGIYVAQLIVRDTRMDSLPDTVAILATATVALF